jgi:hypothetical protein
MDNPIDSLEKIDLAITGKAMQALNATIQKMKAKLIKEQLSGPTSDTSVSRRTGSLARSITEVAAIPEGGTVISARLQAGVVYAPVHIGPRGTTVTIHPSKAKMLAIPLEAAKTGAGVARGAPMSGIWGPTKVFKSKAGNLIIWGYQVGKSAMGTRQKTVTGGHTGAVSISYARGAMEKGELTPLFVLKDSVVIRRRVDPKVDLVDWAKPVLAEEIKKAGLLKANG